MRDIMVDHWCLGQTMTWLCEAVRVVWGDSLPTEWRVLLHEWPVRALSSLAWVSPVSVSLDLVAAEERRAG